MPTGRKYFNAHKGIIARYALTDEINTYLTWSRGYKGAGIDVTTEMVAYGDALYFGGGTALDIELWTTDGTADPRPYLLLGEAVPYKRFDLAIEAANAAGVPLVVAGDGPDAERGVGCHGDLASDVRHAVATGELQVAEFHIGSWPFTDIWVIRVR